MNLNTWVKRSLIIFFSIVFLQWSVPCFHAECDTCSEYYCIPIRDNVVLLFLHEQVLELADYFPESGSGVASKQDMGNILYELNGLQINAVFKQAEDISFYSPNPHTVENDERGTWLTERHVGSWWCYAYRYGTMTPPFISTVRITHYSHFFKTKGGLAFEIDRKAILQNPAQIDCSLYFDDPAFVKEQDGRRIEVLRLADDLYLLYISGIDPKPEGFLYLNDSLLARFQSFEKANGKYCTYCIVSGHEATAIADDARLRIR